MCILTFFNAVLLGPLVLALLGSRDALDALIEVVLVWGALLGLSAFCVCRQRLIAAVLKLSKYIEMLSFESSHRSAMQAHTLFKLVLGIHHLLLLLLFWLVGGGRLVNAGCGLAAHLLAVIGFALVGGRAGRILYCKV
jgi:hypothetical protein